MWAFAASFLLHRLSRMWVMKKGVTLGVNWRAVFIRRQALPVKFHSHLLLRQR